jgi:preprotein translocase subunit SecE
VRSETAKVSWPTRRETITTAIMVLIMTTLLAIFFFGIDSFFGAIVKYLLSLLG